ERAKGEMMLCDHSILLRALMECVRDACNFSRLRRCPAKFTILLANSNQWYFNNLVKNPCHKTHCRCPHRLNLSFQSSRSCALPNIKVLKDKDLEFANSIVHSTGQQTHVLKALQNKYLHYSPANPFLDTRRLISHSRPLLAIWNDV